MSNEAKLLEKPAPAKGQCWKTDGSPSVIEEVVDTSPMPSCRLRGHSSTTPHVHYTRGGWDYISTLMTSDDYAFLGGPSPVSDGGERDWSRWLPPGPLPDTGPKKCLDGQTWAFWAPSGTNGVIRVGPDQNLLASSTREIGSGWCSFADGGNFQRHAVLVADVGCYPTPPEVLYGTAAPPAAGVMGEDEDGYPKLCLQCGGDKAHRAFICVPCSPVTAPYTDVQGVLLDAWRAGRRDFPRPPTESPRAREGVTGIAAR